MILKFCTKRNTNGHRNYLIIDTINNYYQTNYNRWFYKSDFIEITATARKQLIAQLENTGATQSIIE